MYIKNRLNRIIHAMSHSGTKYAIIYEDGNKEIVGREEGIKKILEMEIYKEKVIKEISSKSREKEDAYETFLLAMLGIIRQ